MDKINKISNNDNIKKEEGKIKINLLSPKQIDSFIKNLSNPRFLGSIHMNKENMQHDSSIENLIKGELEHKVNDSLKSSMFNPITKALILIAIIFNILWFTLKFLF